MRKASVSGRQLLKSSNLWIPKLGTPKGRMSSSPATTLILGTLLFIECIAGARSAPPNFVILFLDDHGWGDVGANWNSTKETPNLDRIASKGLRFTDWHAGYSVCTPSRAALLSGRLAPRTGVWSNFGQTSTHGMAVGELLLPQLLESTHDSHMVGKWHLGHNAPYHPTFRGFQTYTGLPYSGDMGCIDSTPQGCKPSYDRSKKQPACPPLCPPDNSTDLSHTAIPLYDTRAPRCEGMEDCAETISMQPFDPSTLNAHYVSAASRIIDTHAARVRAHQERGTDAPKSLLLYVAFAHTHTPLAYDEKRFGNASSRPGFKRVFGNTLAEVDSAVGDIVGFLESAGLARDTLVLITSDNGPADLGPVDCDDIGSAGPFVGSWQKSPSGGGGESAGDARVLLPNSNHNPILTGGSTLKATTWEGGHRVLGLAYWEGTVKPRVSPALVGSVDVVPTLLALSGLTLPSDRSYDGVDLSDVLIHGSDDAHEVMFHPNAYDTPAMRYKNYKAFFETEGIEPCRKPDGSHDPTGKRMKHDPPLVFNLDNDPAESQPINPGKDILDKIQAAYNAFWTDVNTTLQSKTDYSKDAAYRPCSNKSSACCRRTKPTF